jgi:hypothetical protein
VVACRVIEVDAATPVVPVDLTWVLLTRVGPVRDPTFLDSPEDDVKVILAHQERVVLSREIHARFGVVERQMRAEVDSQEEPGWLRIIEPEELGKEVCRLTLVVCRDEKMIELYCHARPLGTPTPPSAGQPPARTRRCADQIRPAASLSTDMITLPANFGTADTAAKGTEPPTYSVDEVAALLGIARGVADECVRNASIGSGCS